MWTTFTPHQIDLDVSHPAARGYLYTVLERLSRAGVGMIRLDAIGYAVKTAGTTCFMTDDTYRFIDELADGVRARGMVSLLEIHAHYTAQQRAAVAVDRVYDFALPPLVLHALYTGSAAPLRRWLEISPRNAITVLDTHDGIGVIDVGPSGARDGLLTPSQIDELIETIHESTQGQSRLATGATASNVDLYQVNTSYYSALGGDDDRYLLARLIQFLCPGIPQVYYGGLLAASNDMALLAKTGVGRDINRPYFDVGEISRALQKPVVEDLVGLIGFRNTHPAFAGDFELGGSEPNELRLSWTTGESSIVATIDVASVSFELRHHSEEGSGVITDWKGFSGYR